MANIREEIDARGEKCCVTFNNGTMMNITCMCRDDDNTFSCCSPGTSCKEFDNDGTSRDGGKDIVCVGPSTPT